MAFRTWIALDADNSWRERCDKLERWASFPQPCYVLPGPGLWPDERFVLISDTPWTADTVRDTLASLYELEDVLTDEDLSANTYAAWIDAWLAEFDPDGAGR